MCWESPFAFSGTFDLSGCLLLYVIFSLFLAAVLFHLMRGGRKRFVAIESLSFDLAIVGIKEDCLQITENGRGRRFTLVLLEQVALWLLRAWSRFCKAKFSNWCNQICWGFSSFLLESKRNWQGSSSNCLPSSMRDNLFSFS